MKSKVTAFFIALVLVSAIPVWSGGQQEVDIDEGVTLEVLNYGDMGTPEGQSWLELVDQFEADYPDIRVDHDSLYDEVYHSRATAQLAAGDVPDLMYVWPTPRSSYAYDAEVLVDLRDYLDLSAYSDAAMAPQGPDGEIYTIPISIGMNSVMYANTQLLDELGMSVPETYDELTAMVEPLRDEGLIPITMGNADTWVMNSTLFGTLVGRFGGPGWFQAAVDGEVSFTDDEFVTALEWLERIYDDGVLPEDSIQTDYGTALSQFNNERAPFLIDGHWRAEGWAEAPFAEDVEWMVFPALDGESYSGSTAGGGAPGYTITTAATENDERLEAAITMLEYITQEPGASIRVETQPGFIPSYEGVSLDDVDFVTQQKSVFYDSVSQVLDTPDAFLPPDTNDVLNNGMQELALGVVTPQELAERVQEQFEQEED